jgi:hypothetical protein
MTQSITVSTVLDSSLASSHLHCSLEALCRVSHFLEEPSSSEKLREKQYEQATIHFKQNIYVTVSSFTFNKNSIVSTATGYSQDIRGVGAQVPVR